MTLLVARDGVGKSAMAGYMAVTMARWFKATGQDLCVKIASFETSEETYLTRLACGISGVPSHRICQGAGPFELRAFEKAFTALDTLPIFFSDQDTDARGLRDFLTTGQKTGVFIVDHAGQITIAGARPGYETQCRVAQGLQKLCRTIAPGIILTHVNRESDKNKDHLPTSANIQGTDWYNKNADLILALHRPDMYEDRPQELQAQEQRALLLILKARYGGDGRTIPLVWEPARTRFTEAGQLEGDEYIEDMLRNRVQERGMTVVEGTMREVGDTW